MLTNIGAVPVYSVTVVCDIPVGVEFGYTTGPPGTTEPGEDVKIDTLVKVSKFSITKLGSLERHPFTCFGFLPVSIKTSFDRIAVANHAWVTVKVHFTLFHIPIVFSNEFPFDGFLQGDGTIRWSEPPLEEAPSGTLEK